MSSAIVKASDIEKVAVKSKNKSTKVKKIDRLAEGNQPHICSTLDANCRSFDHFLLTVSQAKRHFPILDSHDIRRASSSCHPYGSRDNAKQCNSIFI